jgi:hypothetical protein
MAVFSLKRKEYAAGCHIDLSPTLSQMDSIPHGDLLANFFKLLPMSARMQKISKWLAVVIIAGAVLWFGILPRVFGPVIRDTPMMREISRLHEICTKLVYYAEEHHSLAPDNAIGKSLDSLVSSNVISADDVSYIRDHQIEFRGFNPAKISADIAVFETVFTNTRIPRRIVGYSDGHVETYDLQKRQ